MSREAVSSRPFEGSWGLESEQRKESQLLGRCEPGESGDDSQSQYASCMERMDLEARQDG